MTSQLAALDLGSNSFHMVIAENRDGRLQVLDKLKEMVRLADGLDRENKLDPLSSERAIECLSRFSQRLQQVAPENIRVVGTNTLRRARHNRRFMRKAEKALGHEIEIISGREEARLIYLGVSHALEDSHDKRLVVDIGGGSTELILGQQFKPQLLESLFMGCVSFSQRYFPDGAIKRDAIQAAKLAARQELEPVQSQYRNAGWTTAIGASGTILAVQDVLRANDWNPHNITLDGLEKLIAVLEQAEKVDNLSLQGLATDRRPVFVGGVAILIAIFEALQLEQMTVSTGALREGLLYDLLGRTSSEDIRDNSIHDLTQRYHIDVGQATRISQTGANFFDQLEKPWKLSRNRHLPLLQWAVLLHEVGMDVSHRQYHKHGGYLIRYMDMAGFAQLEQEYLALLVRAHRRKFPFAEFRALPPRDRTALIRLAIILRLSVVLHRNRGSEELPDIRVRIRKNMLSLHFPPDWIKQHPLTQLDLTQEADYLAATPVQLIFDQTG